MVLLFVSNINGQTAYGRLKIKTKFKREYVWLWDRFIIKNKDTTMYFDRDRYRKTIIDSLPIGQYTIMLNSTFRDNIPQVINIKKRTTIKFNAANYYQPYIDSNSIIDLMAVRDTCLIYDSPGGCWSPPPYYCMLVKDSLKYKIIVRNDSNKLESVNLTNMEISDLRGLGRYSKPRKKMFCGRSGAAAHYYWGFNNRVLYKRICRSYFYDLLRVRTIKPYF